MAAGKPNKFLSKEETRSIIEAQISMNLGVPIIIGKGFIEYLEALFIREYFCSEEEFKEYSTMTGIRGGWDEAVEKYEFLNSKIDQDVIRWKDDLQSTDTILYENIENELKDRWGCVHLYGDVPILLGKYFKEKSIENNLDDPEIVKAFANGVPFDWIADKIQMQSERLLVTAKTTQEHIDKINSFMNDKLKINAAILPLSFNLNGIVFGKLNNTGKFAYLFNELETAGFIRKDWQRCVSLGIAIKSQKNDLIKPKDLSKALTKAIQEQYDYDKIDEYKQIKKFIQDLQEFQ